MILMLLLLPPNGSSTHSTNNVVDAAPPMWTLSLHTWQPISNDKIIFLPLPFAPLNVNESTIVKLKCMYGSLCKIQTKLRRQSWSACNRRGILHDFFRSNRPTIKDDHINNNLDKIFSSKFQQKKGFRILTVDLSKIPSCVMHVHIYIPIIFYSNVKFLRICIRSRNRRRKFHYVLAFFWLITI